MQKSRLQDLNRRFEQLESKFGSTEREREVERIRNGYRRLTRAEREEVTEILGEMHDIAEKMSTALDGSDEEEILAQLSKPCRKRWYELISLMDDESLGDAEREQREKIQLQGDNRWRPPSRKWRPRPLPSLESGG
jgi:hypothetical protein